MEDINNLPHVVKFSGGRSSGMMLMQLLQKNALNPQRGDVILFNNTSAEHPATYEFIRKMKKMAEEKYNIPFFWIEYQTYEDASNQGWRRHQSYRLVNENPYSRKNQNGYRHKGEVFEEMISLKGYLPNMLSRTCTLAMKISTTNAFLEDWFAQKNGIGRLGHYWESVRMTDSDVIQKHKKNRGTTPDKILLAKRNFVRNSAFIREAANWADYTHCEMCFDNPEIKDSVIGGKAELFGDYAVAYVSYLGIRKDEELRIEKIKARIENARTRQVKSNAEQPPHENALAPLVEDGVTKQEVVEFWQKQDFNLDLPDSGLLSNCVYCPLKGKAKLTSIAAAELANGKNGSGTPASINWWIGMENKYSRDLKAEKREIKNDKYNYIGFFGASPHKTIYAQIKKDAQQKSRAGEVTNAKAAAEYLEQEDYTPCNCTD